MKNLLKLFLLHHCVFFVLTSEAQNIDSLINITKTSRNPDEKAIAYFSIAKIYFYKNLDSCEYFMKQAYNMKDEFNADSLKDKAISLYIVAHIENKRGNASQELILNAINYLKESDRENMLKDLYNSYGNFFLYKRNLEGALEWYEKSLLLEIELESDPVGLAMSYSNIALILDKLERQEEALENLHSALAVLKKSSEKASVFKVYISLAQLYGKPYIDGTGIYNPDSAIYYAEQAMEVTEKIGFVQGTIESKRTLVKTLLYLRDPSEKDAKRMTELAIEIENFYKGKNVPMPFMQLARGKGALILGNLTLAESLITPLLNDSSAREVAHKVAHELYLAKGNYPKSLMYYKKYKSIGDSLKYVKNQGKLAELQTKYETERKETEIVKLAKEAEVKELESKQNRNYFIGASIIGLLIFGISIIANNQLRLRRKADLAQEQLKNSEIKMQLENQFRESELKALKSQMNPHFIFNALNSIQEYIILNDKENAANYLGKFADLIRNYLYHSNTGKITLSDELEALKLYLELEQVRFEDEFSFEIKKTLQDSAENIEIPTMLIQPYVENAIKHGLLHKAGEKKLLLQFIERENALECQIIDNGVGRKRSAEINAKRRKGHQSFASEATQTRLELLNHQSEAKIGVDIEDLKDGSQALGTKVVIRIPLV